MQGFQETSVLSPASEAIATTFEKFLQLAGGLNTNPNPNPQEGSRAQEVLYVLDSLKDTLPLMSLKFSTRILYYFKYLLALHQPVATRRITDALYLLCLQPTVDVSPEALVDLLCSLATSVSSNEMSGDNLSFVARLLDAGMKKVFSLNRHACVVKLPVVFSAFKDILASEHEEPLSVAMEALKSLIHTCVDGSLIKQGVDQILASGSVRKSAPTIIEKLCATVESLLDYRFAAVWDMSFQVVAAMFDKLGEFSSCFLKGTLKSLEGIQKLPDDDFLYRKQASSVYEECSFLFVRMLLLSVIKVPRVSLQLHDCMGVAVVALGPETFLKLLPLNVEAKDLSDVNVWLFPILKQNIVGARLSFFNESLLDNIKVLKLKSTRNLDGLVYSLWSLLPSFCNYPVDTAESFNDLEQELCRSLREESDFRGVICSSLQILVQQNKRITGAENEPSGKVSISQQRAVSVYTPEVAARNLDVLRSSARGILSTLSRVFMKSTKDDSGSLRVAILTCIDCRTIGEFASIADESVVSKLYKSTMQKLVKVTQEAGKINNSSNGTSPSLTRAKLYDLAVALLPGFGTTEVDHLFDAVEPALKDTESLIQKKAYKILSTILKHDDSFIARKFEELLKMMFEAMHSCHFSAKRHRLDCLYFLIAHVSKVTRKRKLHLVKGSHCMHKLETRCNKRLVLQDESEHMKREIVASLLTEILLGLKESNKKTRNRAYEIIVEIGHACVDEDKGGNKENLYNFFNMVAGGLAGESPHMISAAVKGMARLTYEFNDLLSNAFDVLPSTFLLLQRKNREINKVRIF
ncbi:putative armadillo-like helical protein [Helianthus annuus]|nr:putative armadillo-like helical protein [Helianthus annuus]